MRSLSQQILMLFPALLALALVVLFAAPMPGGTLSYTPNVAWLMTLVMVAHYPPAWPRGLAFILGFLQDMLFGTPLGSQALLALLLAQFAVQQNRMHAVQLFRLRWLESAGVLVILHLLLWALMSFAAHEVIVLRHLLRAGLINALWYPVFYWFLTRLFAVLPDAK
jgi:rod shape-determining protein MreD